MEIKQTTTITGIPGFAEIRVEPAKVDSVGAVIVMISSNDLERECRFDVNQVIEQRDALTAAIEYAECMAGVKPVRLFTPGQIVDGTEDLPVGTTLRDKEGDLWLVRAANGWSQGSPEDGWSNSTSASTYIAWQYAPVKIESLP